MFLSAGRRRCSRRVRRRARARLIGPALPPGSSGVPGRTPCGRPLVPSLDSAYAVLVEAARHHGRSDAHRDLVVIGASAGGVEVLTRVVKGLPADLRAAVCIVLHIAPGSPSMLAHILDRAGPLPCLPARDGDPLREGVILVAPPDRHLAIEDGHARLTVGPRENGHRPSIDVLFRSAAALESRVIGVVLTGNRDDGSAGLAVIKASGGATIVQDPNDAMYAGMPASAIAQIAVDAIVPSALVASTIAAMVNGDDPPGVAGMSLGRLVETESDPNLAEAEGTA